ncbi:MAG: hypothetical protein HYX75_07950 [Acidobacteria bacterium]|nr:hypothetical protein [Acidobacteriota bacterium]
MPGITAFDKLENQDFEGSPAGIHHGQQTHIEEEVALLEPLSQPDRVLQLTSSATYHDIAAISMPVERIEVTGQADQPQKAQNTQKAQREGLEEW